MSKKDRDFNYTQFYHISMILVSVFTFSNIKSAQAQNSIQDRACMAIDDDSERLKCFDIVMKEKYSKSEQNNEWTITNEKSKMDKSNLVIAGLSSADMSSRNIKIIARCKENETDFFVVFDKYLGSESNDKKMVTYRIDDEKPRTENWDISTNSKSIFLPTNKIAFLRKLSSSKEIIIRVTPYGESPITVTFDLTKSRDPISAVANACNWKL